MLLIKRYGFYGMLKLITDVVVFSRLLFPNVRITKRPFYIRGEKHVHIGKHFSSGVGLRIDAFPIDDGMCIEIGENVGLHPCG